MSYSNGPKIIIDGLVYCLDPENIKSYVSGSNTVYDLSGNGYNATGQGMTFVTKSLAYGSNKAYFYSDGTGDTGGGKNSINFGSNASNCFNLLGRATTLTYTMWVKIDGVDGNNHYFIGFADDYTKPSLRIGTVGRGPLNISAQFGPNNNYDDYYLRVSYGKYYNKWTHVGVTTDSSNTIRCYLNGKLAGTQRRPYGTIRDFPALASIYYSRIGIDPYYYNNGIILGGIGPVQLYNRTLNESEIYQNYISTSGRFFDLDTLYSTKLNVEYLIVAGGGSGGDGQGVNGGAGGGGGGAGGVLFGTYNITTSSVNIIVGEGGRVVTSSFVHGYPSSIDSIWATGGNGGAIGYTGDGYGGDGGSGGGSYYGAGYWAYGKGAQGEGFDGNGGDGGFGYAGGGGGAGGTGSAGVYLLGGAGGKGISNNITGTSVYYGGGGGGGSDGVGGLGGGGNGGNDLVYPASGSPNTGGGGGGGGPGGTALGPGGKGGSGIVVLAYPTNTEYNITVPDSLTYTASRTSRSGYVVASFISGSGSLTVSKMLSYSDDFNRGTTTDNLGTNWTTQTGFVRIYSNRAAMSETTNTDNLTTYNTPINTTNAYQLLVFSNYTGYGRVGPCFRFTNSSSPFYTVEFDRINNIIYWAHWTSVGGTRTEIASASFTIGTTGEIYGITISGTGNNTIVNIWKNPTALTPTSVLEWDSGDTVPDVSFTTNPSSPINTGYYGGLFSNFSGDCLIDNWYYGDAPQF